MLTQGINHKLVQLSVYKHQRDKKNDYNKEQCQINLCKISEFLWCVYTQIYFVGRTQLLLLGLIQKTNN